MTEKKKSKKFEIYPIFTKKKSRFRAFSTSVCLAIQSIPSPSSIIINHMMGYKDKKKIRKFQNDSYKYVFLFLILISSLFFILHHQNDLRDVFKTSTSSKCKYGIVIDAGSSGTRLHAYKMTDDGFLEEVVQKKITPGISAYVENPEDLSNTLTRLTDYAENKIPSHCRSITSIHLMATAGMRLVSISDKDIILKAVRKALKQSSFMFRDDWASVIPGQTEALYDWISVNLAVGALPVTSTDYLVGATDLGGASTQLAYPVSSSSRKNPNVVSLSLPSKNGPRVEVRVYKFNFVFPFISFSTCTFSYSLTCASTISRFRFMLFQDYDMECTKHTSK